MSNWLDLSNVSNILRQTYVNGFLDASGPIIGRADVSFNQKLFVSKDVSLNARLFVGQDASFNNNVFVKNYVYSSTPVASDNSNKLATTAYVQDKLSVLSSSASFVGDVTLFNRLFAYGDVSMGGNLFALGKTILGGDVSMNTRLYVGYDASFGGNLAVNSGNILLSKITGSSNLSTVSPYSSNASSNTWTNNGVTWTASASGASTTNAFWGFLPSGWYVWASNSGYSASSPYAYTGSYSTTVSGTAINGEWLQIQSSAPITLTNYYFVTRSAAATFVSYNYINYLPGNYTILGSNDGTTWSKLQEGSITALPVPTTNPVTQNTSNYAVTTSGTASQFANNSITGYAAAASAYTYFRIVVKNVIGRQFGATTDTDGYTEFGWNPTFSSGSSTLSTSSVLVQLNNTAANQLDISGSLFVSNDVSLNSRLYVRSDVSLNSRLYVGSDASLGGRLFVMGDVSINGLVSVPTQVASDNSTKVATTQYVTTALSAFSGAYATFRGDVSINNRLFVGSDVSMGNRLFVAGDVSMNSNVSVPTPASNDNSTKVATTQYVTTALSAFSGASARFGGDVSINSRIIVGGDASVGGNLFTSGDASFGGKITIYSSAKEPLLVAGGQGLNTLAYSYDGLNWTALGTTIFSFACYYVLWNGTMFVAVGETNTMAYSYNGISWTVISSPPVTGAGVALGWNGSMCVVEEEIH